LKIVKCINYMMRASSVKTLIIELKYLRK